MKGAAAMAGSGTRRVKILAGAALSLVTMAGCTIEGHPMAAPSTGSAPASADPGFTPTETDQDPSTRIPGVVTETYSAGLHVMPTERVAYDHSPPFGGRHDGYWAACNGVVYPTAVRTENMVHSLEHGTVWIAYDPARISGAALDSLKARVEDKPYTMMSPYPGLDKPISLQSWGHQLKVDTAGDARIDQFVTALRGNEYTYPEVGASCDALGAGLFDPDAPPPFDPSPPGSDAAPPK
jgi:hypothetical protein